jgi:methyl-accepting chemotaxis protein
VKQLLGRSLAIRVVAPIALLLAVLVAAGVTLLTTVNAADANRAMEERANVTTRIIAGGLSASLWDVDKAAATVQLSGLANDPDYRNSQVLDAEGKLFARHGDVSDASNGLTQKADIVRVENGKTEVLGTVQVSLSKTRSEAQISARATMIAMTGGVIIVGLCVALFLIVRGATRPIVRLTATMSRLAAGDAAVDVPSRGRSDEVGRMAAAVEVFKDNALERTRLAGVHKAAQQQAEVEKRDALVGMAGKIETETGQALDQVSRHTAEMTQTADAMNASANRTDVSARAAAAAATQALANTQTVSSAAEQLAASIREIGGQVNQSTASVGRAVEAGQKTRATMEALNQQVERIGAVADMIGEIAGKTNLLALNATIEAARAGDAGKGFAVVASEVKQLATQTARSTQDIAQHLSEVRKATGESVAAVARIEQTIGEVNTIAGSIAAAVEQQGAATAEIARNVNETAAAATEMTRRIGEVSNEAAKTGQHAASVRDSATGLTRQVEELRHVVIRVVRTSTTEVDRRGSPRERVDLPCRLNVGGGSHPGRTIDLSMGGAAVAGGPQLTPGTRGTLDLEGVRVPVPFEVRACVDGVLRLAFHMDTTSTAAFQSWLEGRRRRDAA